MLCSVFHCSLAVHTLARIIDVGPSSHQPIDIMFTSVFGRGFSFLDPLQAPGLLFLPWFMPSVPERWGISNHSLAVCISYCFTAMKVSFWSPLCRLLLGAQAPLPALFSAPFEKRGMYYLKVRCFTAWSSFEIRPGSLVLFSSSEQVRAGRSHFATSLCARQPAPRTDARELALGAGSALAWADSWGNALPAMGHATQQREIWVITWFWQWYPLFKLTDEPVIMILGVR